MSAYAMHVALVNKYEERTTIVLANFNRRVLQQKTTVEDADFIIGSWFLML